MNRKEPVVGSHPLQRPMPSERHSSIQHASIHLKHHGIAKGLDERPSTLHQDVIMEIECARPADQRRRVGAGLASTCPQVIPPHCKGPRNSVPVDDPPRLARKYTFLEANSSPSATCTRERPPLRAETCYVLQLHSATVCRWNSVCSPNWTGENSSVWP